MAVIGHNSISDWSFADWSSSDRDGDLAPFAPKVGPFPRRGFLQSWWEEFAPDAKLLVLASEHGALPLMETSGLIQFIGDSDLTDYHSPLGPDLDGPIEALSALVDGNVSIDLDSLPEEAATAMAERFARIGLDPKVSEQIIARVLELPATIEEYYEFVGKKERHELRRKRRRYEDQVGVVALHTDLGAGFGFEEFVRLHRLAPGDKGSFMTGERHRFFMRLAQQEGWRVDYLETGGQATACLFGWTDGVDYFLYNSSFDPDLHAASPGQVVLLAMIEQSIAQGWKTFDFLKGDEAYKARLGAVPRQLFRVEVSG